MRKLVTAVLALGLVMALGFAHPLQASYACVEISDGHGTCFGECTIYDDQTGAVTGRIIYLC